jgi:hypothetical protein
MGTEIAINKPGQIVAQPAQSLDQFIIQACNTEGFDVDKLERLVALQERREEQTRKEAFEAALLRVQMKAPRILQNGMMDRGSGGKIPYAKREDIDAVMRPLYQAEGFTVTWDGPLSADGSRINVTGRFTCGGHTEERVWPCAPDPSGGKTGPQAVSSTIAYGKRQISKMVWDIIEEGLDKNGAKHQDVTPITQDQADDIRTRMNELPQSKPGIFLEKLCRKYGVGRPEELRVSQLDNALADVAATVDRSAK